MVMKRIASLIIRGSFSVSIIISSRFFAVAVLKLDSASVIFQRVMASLIWV